MTLKLHCNSVALGWTGNIRIPQILMGEGTLHAGQFLRSIPRPSATTVP